MVSSKYLFAGIAITAAAACAAVFLKGGRGVSPGAEMDDAIYGKSVAVADYMDGIAASEELADVVSHSDRRTDVRGIEKIEGFSFVKPASWDEKVLLPVFCVKVRNISGSTRDVYVSVPVGGGEDPFMLYGHAVCIPDGGERWIICGDDGSRTDVPEDFAEIVGGDAMFAAEESIYEDAGGSVSFDSGSDGSTGWCSMHNGWNEDVASSVRFIFYKDGKPVDAAEHRLTGKKGSIVASGSDSDEIVAGSPVDGCDSTVVDANAYAVRPKKW